MLRTYLILLAVLLFLAGCISESEPQGVKPGLPDSLPQPEKKLKASSPASPEESSQTALNESAGNLTVHFIDVGQGDAILIQLPNGKEILIDGGNIGKGVDVARYLVSEGVDELDVVVSTSPDADHLGGLLYVLQNFRVGEVVESGQSHTTKTYAEYKAIIHNQNLTVKAVSRGHFLSLDQRVLILVMSPPRSLFKGTRSDTNANSVVLLIDYNNTEILLTGDAEAITEDYLLIDPLDIDILKVAHHGSKYSSTWRFLSTIKPKVGVISAGCNNPYGHPHEETIYKLAILGVKVFTTCRNGDVVVTSDGVNYAVITENETLPPETVSTNTSSRIVICRAIFNPPGSEPENEVITLCNYGDAQVDISGWTISDGEGSYKIPIGTTIEAGNEWMVMGSTYNPTGDPKGLFLNNRHDEVMLFNLQGELVDLQAW